MSRLLVTSLTLLVLLSGVLAARAADDSVIVIGDEEVLRIRASSGGYSAAQRADALRKRLIDIYAAIGQSDKALRPEEVTLDLTPGAPSIRVRGLLLLSVTQDDAKINGYKSVDDLAKVWHERLRSALVKAAPLPGNTQYRTPGDPGTGFP